MTDLLLQHDDSSQDAHNGDGICDDEAFRWQMSHALFNPNEIDMPLIAQCKLQIFNAAIGAG